jgi:hypothetical protein
MANKSGAGEVPNPFPEGLAFWLLSFCLEASSALLAERLIAATNWTRADSATRELPMGYFGASTGAAAALVAASQRPDIFAVVSRDWFSRHLASPAARREG